MVSKFLPFILLASTSACFGQILDQLSKGKDDSPIIIEAENEVVCDETTNKCVATGLAKAQSGTSIVYGDVLTVYFTKGKDREITAMTADGNVRMETPNETAYGDHAHYDVALDRVRLTGGDLKIVTPKETLTAKDSIEYWHKENKGIARGNAVAHFHDKSQSAQADLMEAYFVHADEKTEEGKGKLQIDRIFMSGGDLKIITPNETLTAKDSMEYYRNESKGIAKGNAVARFKDKDQIVRGDTLTAFFIPGSQKTSDGKVKMELEKVEALGNVLASGPDGIVTGDKGVYYDKTDIVEVFDNVKVTQEGNVIEGGYAKANLKTNVAEMYTDQPSNEQECPKKRISGIIIPKDAKKGKNGQIFQSSGKKRDNKQVNVQ